MANEFDTVDEFFTDEFAKNATYSGNTVKAIVTKLKKGKTYDELGVIPEVDFMLLVRASQITPVVDAKITYNSVDYRITNFELDSTEKMYRLDLGKWYG